MHEPDTMVTDVLPSGRHRLQSSALRRAASRMSLGAAAVLLTIVVGVLTAVTTGLTGGAAGGSSNLSVGHLPDEAQAEPTPRWNAATRARPTVEAAPSPPAEVAPSPAARTAPAAASAPVPAPEPLPTVRQNQPCSAEGARGVTAAGRPAVCTERGNGVTRWRHA